MVWWKLNVYEIFFIQTSKQLPDIFSTPLFVFCWWKSDYSTPHTRFFKDIAMKSWARGYKTFFMLNSAEHEICPANKSQITDNCKFFHAKHSWAWKFLC